MACSRRRGSTCAPRLMPVIDTTSVVNCPPMLAEFLFHQPLFAVLDLVEHTRVSAEIRSSRTNLASGAQSNVWVIPWNPSVSRAPREEWTAGQSVQDRRWVGAHVLFSYAITGHYRYDP